MTAVWDSRKMGHLIYPLLSVSSGDNADIWRILLCESEYDMERLFQVVCHFTDVAILLQLMKDVA